MPPVLHKDCRAAPHLQLPVGWWFQCSLYPPDSQKNRTPLEPPILSWAYIDRRNLKRRRLDYPRRRITNNGSSMPASQNILVRSKGANVTIHKCMFYLFVARVVVHSRPDHLVIRELFIASRWPSAGKSWELNIFASQMRLPSVLTLTRSETQCTASS